jgi:hypothetical protein
MKLPSPSGKIISMADDPFPSTPRLSSSLLPSCLPNKTLNASPFSTGATCSAHLIFLHLFTQTLFGEYTSLSSLLPSLLHPLLPRPS